MLFGVGRTLLGGTAFEAESVAIFAAFSVSPSDVRKRQINRFVAALKSSSIWTKLDCLYVFAAADSQAALINWKNPGTLNATTGGTISFTADRGFTSNGTSGYIDSGFVPSTAGGVYVQNSAHISARSLTSQAGSNTTTRLFGNISSTTPRSTLLARSAADTFSSRINCANDITGASTESRGHFILNRSASNAVQIYRDGASAVTSAEASTALPTTSVVFCRDLTAYGTLQTASGSIGSSLNGTEANALEDAELAYMQAVGAA